MIGGVIAAVLFELAKYGFGIYVRAMTGFQTIYGALAVIPIFLIWIYTSWVVLLLGAHITYCLSAFRLDLEKRGMKDHDWSFYEVYQVIHLLWLAQKEGKSVSGVDVRKGGIRIPQHQVNEIMGYLQTANWVQATGNGNWILSRDMDEVSILDLVRIIPRPLPMESMGTDTLRGQEKLGELFERYQELLQENLEIPLSELLQKETSPVVEEEVK